MSCRPVYLGDFFKRAHNRLGLEACPESDCDSDDCSYKDDCHHYYNSRLIRNKLYDIVRTEDIPEPKLLYLISPYGTSSKVIKLFRKLASYQHFVHPTIVKFLEEHKIARLIPDPALERELNCRLEILLEMELEHELEP